MDERVPLLVKLSVARTGEDRLPGRYDDSQQVWVVDHGHGANPIVNASDELVELRTKTLSAPERDDTDALLELSTKNEARPERDRQDRDDRPGSFSLLGMLELVTKTKAQAERDDA
jgi:hypothetical protein